MKVKEYVDFAHFENDPHRHDVDLICIVGNPNGYVCADFITDCRRWQTAFRRFFNVLGSDPRFEGWDSTVYEAMLNGVWKDKELVDDKYTGGWFWEVEDLDGEPLCTVCLITQSEAAAIAKEQELTKAGLTAWYDQIQ